MSIKTDIMIMYVLGLNKSGSNIDLATQSIQQRKLESLTPLSKPFVRERVNEYSAERSARLKVMGLFDDLIPKVLLLDEVKARLDISDSHIIYDLINDEKLLDNIYPVLKQSIERTQHPHRVLITLDSFTKYLGEYTDKVLFNSKKAVDRLELDLTVNQLSRVAKNYDLGFKIKSRSRSARLYSQDDLEKITFIKNKSFKDKLPAIYAQYMMGMNVKQLTNIFGLENSKKTKLAIDAYKLKRKSLLNQHNISNIDDILTVSEVSTLLNTQKVISKNYIINNCSKYTLINLKGKEHVFVETECLRNQLGREYSRKLLYSSTQVSEMIDRPTKEIDVIAKYSKLGFKLKNNHQGNYRFSEKDITKIKNTQIRYYEGVLTLTNLKSGKSESFNVFK